MDDNRMVYLEAVPPTESLTPVGKAALVKPIEPAFGAGASDAKPLFNGLLPRFVMQEVEAHKASLRSMIEACESDTKLANAAAREALAEKGLPGSIAAHEATDGFPESVWTKVSLPTLPTLPTLPHIIVTKTMELNSAMRAAFGDEQN